MALTLLRGQQAYATLHQIDDEHALDASRKASSCSSRELKVKSLSGTMSDSEAVEWGNVVTEVVLLRTMTWASMPITFCFAWYRFGSCLWTFVVSKCIVILSLQFAIREQMKTVLTKMRPDSPEVAALNSPLDCWPRRATVWAVTAAALEATLSLCSSMLNFIEIVDPDMDAMTPGNSKHTFNEQDDAKFAESWSHVPFLGPVVAYLKLPTVLILGMTLISMWQLWVFRSKIGMLRRSIERRLIKDTYIQLCQSADCANLHILGSLAGRLWLVVDVEAAGFGGIRVSTYRGRMPETIFQAWFAVSAVAFAYSKPLAKVAPLLVSAITSYATSIRLVCHISFKFMPWHNWCTRQRDAGHSMRMVRLTLLMVIVHAFALIAIGSRAVGIWACSTHDFLLGSMTCS